MTTGPGRILTTHTGSLPRPDDLIRMMWAKADGVPVDPAALGERIALAVQEVVERQASCGIDIVNDGEMSKPSYATYVQDRLTGFAGESIQDYFFADLVDYPRSADLVAANPGRRKRSAPACTAEISVRPGDESVDVDLRNLTIALAGVGVAGSFSSAASPGVVSLFFANQHYPTDEDYLLAIAEAMRAEYEAIAAAGVTVQVDCPDLAMGRHSAYASMDLAAFRRRIALNIEALNHAVRNIPAEQLRMHLCWGNYPGPHHHDVDLADIVDLVWQAKPRTVLARGGQPASCPRVDALRARRTARRQDPVSGRRRAAVELHRASGAGGATDLPVRGPGRSGPGDGRRRLRVQRPRRHAGHRPRRGLGQARCSRARSRDRQRAPLERGLMTTTQVSRLIKAPRSQVYRALLDPEAVQRWMVPHGMTSEVHAFEPHEGGVFRISLTYDEPTDTGKTTSRTDSFHGRFIELVPDTKVVQVVEFETDDASVSGEMTISYRLSETAEGTQITGLHENVPPGVDPAQNELGWTISLGKLADLLEGELPTV